MTIYTCDDDTLQMQKTLTFLNTYITTASIPDEPICQSITPEELQKAVSDQTFRADLLLLDIEMQGVNGIDIAKEINQLRPDCQIIFLTSYLEYASYVYDANHLYFVLKSKMDEMLPKALDKAFHLLTDVGDLLSLSISGQQISLPMNKIYYIEKEGHNSKIYTESNFLMSPLSLRELIDLLNQDFIRCHGGFIISLRNVMEFGPSGFQLKNHIQVPIGRTFQKSSKKAYLDYLSKNL